MSKLGLQKDWIPATYAQNFEFKFERILYVFLIRNKPLNNILRPKNLNQKQMNLNLQTIHLQN